MSMLSMQIDELREASRNIQGKLGRCRYRRKDVNEMQQVSDMLCEAANTIESIGNGTLTAGQVREAVMSADRWEKPLGNTGLTNTHLIIRDDGWQAIADKLNAALGIEVD